jgi:hypothetical protein
MVTKLIKSEMKKTKDVSIRGKLESNIPDEH